MHIYKSKSAISFNEFKKQINEHHDFENDWGFYIDIDNINNSNNNNNNNDNEFTPFLIQNAPFGGSYE